MSFLLNWNGRQTRRRNGLPVTLFLLVRYVKADSLGDVRELLPEDLLGDLQDAISALSRHDTAQHQKIADVVEVGVGRDVISEVNTDGVVDFHRAGIAGGRELLHVLE